MNYFFHQQFSPTIVGCPLFVGYLGVDVFYVGSYVRCGLKITCFGILVAFLVLTLWAVYVHKSCGDQNLCLVAVVDGFMLGVVVFWWMIECILFGLNVIPDGEGIELA